MNAETIMSAMNYIDSDILYNTEQIRNGKEKIISKKAYRILVAAACFVFTAFSALFINTVINNSMPKLELTVNNSNGMGFEGAFLKNPDDFESDNPWEYSLLTLRMPVYENNSHDEKGTPCALSEKQLDALVDKAVSSLGVSINNTSKSYANDLYGGYEADFVYCITAETDVASITANAAGGLTVEFASLSAILMNLTPEKLQNIFRICILNLFHLSSALKNRKSVFQPITMSTVKFIAHIKFMMQAETKKRILLTITSTLLNYASTITAL